MIVQTRKPHSHEAIRQAHWYMGFPACNKLCCFVGCFGRSHWASEVSQAHDRKGRTPARAQQILGARSTCTTHHAIRVLSAQVPCVASHQHEIPRALTYSRGHWAACIPGGCYGIRIRIRARDPARPGRGGSVSRLLLQFCGG